MLSAFSPTQIYLFMFNCPSESFEKRSLATKYRILLPEKGRLISLQTFTNLDCFTSDLNPQPSTLIYKPQTLNPKP